LGSLYGVLIGLIPTLGPSTGLILLTTIPLHLWFDPYQCLSFYIACIAACPTGDVFSSILLGIPGSSSSMTTIFDGHPMAKSGKGAEAIIAALTSSSINGLLWAMLVLFFMPLYENVVLYLGIPELFLLHILSLACVAFLFQNSKFLGVVSIAIGIFLGLIGQDENMNARFTFDWIYLENGISLPIFIAGVFAAPEIISFLNKNSTLADFIPWHRGTLSKTLKEVRKNIKLSLTGGAFGAFAGFLPGVSASIGEFLAYTYATKKNKSEKFGNGNIKGVIGAEGANNAAVVTSFLPTLLLGIPGTPFAAIMIGLLSTLNFEVGSINLIQNDQFFLVLGLSFIASIIFTWVLCLFGIRIAHFLLKIPFKVYGPITLVMLAVASYQNTHTYHDILLFGILSFFGVLLKRFKINRPAVLLAFVLIKNLENLAFQMSSLYTPMSFISRPIVVFMLALTLLYAIFSFRKNTLPWRGK
jgi:TctA family transporter